MNLRVLRLAVYAVLAALFLASLAWFGVQNYRSGMPLNLVFLNSFILAVPLVILYLSIGLLFEAWQRRYSGQEFGAGMSKFLYRTPRIAGLVVVFFISLFALDVFGTGTLWQQIGAFLIHAAPALLLGVLLLLSWKRPLVGASIFGLAALFFLVRFVIPGREFGFGNLLLFVMPMALVAALFWANWKWRTDIRW